MSELPQSVKGAILDLETADFGSYQRGASMFFRNVRREAVPVAA